MKFRSIAAADFARIPHRTVPFDWATAVQYDERRTAGQYRPQWTWLAEDGDRVLARAMWWGFGDGEHPLALDYLYVHHSVADPATLVGDLLNAAHETFLAEGAPELPAYHLKLPLNWRADPASVAAVDWRRTAAARAGLSEDNERLRYEWTPADGLPEPPARLDFRPEPDDDVMLSVFRRLTEGSLDTETRRGVTAVGVDAHARADFEFYRDQMPGPREWWRLAYTAGGDLVGLALPSRNASNAVVGYLGVLPEHRGHGYIHDLLAHITRHHAELGASRVVADTDLVNQPMAAAFTRGRYRNIEMRLVFSAPH
ncbi:GNAT family N-acetyltransferase [Crossiella cryophila]|uniref:GNAT superfamily N-acetyltransferase n=1 Tax=Crossiella cryophila TaxID=43355 RepID=A0A7W7CIC4_9PSEU|nr:GNAT family N-acetyltransferase [Crossiella cryophila]MBB4681749.1 GNAT superfamily N-acetyltransferase [Crossiella cryophila]